jgi:hypothetical protein
VKKTRREEGASLVRLLLLLLLLLLGHASEPVKADGGEDVEDDKSPKDAEVAPAVGVAAVDLVEEDVGVGVRAEAAGRLARTGAQLEAAGEAGIKPLGHVGVTVLAGRGRELDELVVGAGDFVAGKADAEHAGDEVGEGRDAVHEDPEAREGAGGRDDTAEDETEGEHQVGDVAAGFRVGDTSDDHVGEGGCEEEELQDEEEEQSAALVSRSGSGGVLLQADGVVEADEDDDGHESVPREFDSDVGDHESLPRVGSAGALANLVQGTLCYEMRHDLLTELTEDGEEQEDREHLVLNTLLSERGAEEDESDEDGRTKTESSLGVDVGWSAPVLLEDTLGNLPELETERCGEFAVGLLVVGCSGLLDLFRTLISEEVELTLHLLILFAAAPNLVPVDIRVRTRCCANDFQHPFGGVGIGRALVGAVLFEVAGKDVGVLADFTVVDRAATFGKEQEAIEALEEHSRRLVDCAENSLARVGKLLKQIENSPRCLRIKTRRWLVQEQEKLGFGS